MTLTVGYLIAYYFVIVVAGAPCPMLAGPYHDRLSCFAVNEWLEGAGFETGQCSMMSVPQEAVLIQVGDAPRKEMVDDYQRNTVGHSEGQ
jgi:hypothetical protein